MVKGEAKQESLGLANVKYVGLAPVEIRAINPTRAQLNKLLGKEDSEDDKEIEYLTTDQDGTDRVRLSFWLYNRKLDKYFVHSFNLSKKERLSKDGVKNQYINSVCATAWTDDESNLPNWFTTFLDKDKVTELGTKKYRKALLGEEELAKVLSVWLGRLNWSKPTSEVMIDTDLLFREDYSELRSLIDGDYDTPFVVLLGVKTDENDSEKQYQQVFNKAFLPAGFAGYIERGMKFPTDYTRKVWNKFENEATDPQYGFSAYYKLEGVKEYNKDEDVATASRSKADVTPSNSKY